MAIPVGAELTAALKRMVFYVLEKKKMELKLMLKPVEKHLHRSASAGRALSLP